MNLARRSFLVCLLAAATVSAQPPATRRATNIAAITAHPAFYHLRPIFIVGDIKLLESGEFRVGNDNGSLPLALTGDAAAREGLSEVRGEFWDLGRLNADDPRLAGMDLRRMFKIDPEGAWPRPGQVTAIVASNIQPATPPNAPSVRNVVLYPSRYQEQAITLVGQFGGRNLLGDLPEAPGQSRWDFVLRSADAAIWVSNLRPRGRDFELALDARIDTGRWLEVTGTLQQGRGLQWLDGQAGTVKLTQAPRQATEDIQPIRVPASPPPEVVFSTPLDDETDVRTATNVRVQFSRDIDASTIRGRVRASYAALPAEAAPPAAPAFTTQYLPGTRVLEIRFTQPLERFRTVTIELLEGVLGSDKQPLAPWKITFLTDGS